MPRGLAGINGQNHTEPRPFLSQRGFSAPILSQCKHQRGGVRLAARVALGMLNSGARNGHANFDADEYVSAGRQRRGPQRVAFDEEYRRRGHEVLIIAPEADDTQDDGSNVMPSVPAIQHFNGSEFPIPVPSPGLVAATVDEFRPTSFTRIIRFSWATRRCAWPARGRCRSCLRITRCGTSTRTTRPLKRRRRPGSLAH